MYGYITNYCYAEDLFLIGVLISCLAYLSIWVCWNPLVCAASLCLSPLNWDDGCCARWCHSILVRTFERRDAEMARVSLAAVPDIKANPVWNTGNAHARSAALRSSGNRVALEFSLSIGSGLYYYDISHSSQLRGYRGVSLFVGDKDLQKVFQDDPVEDDDVIRVTDRDYLVPEVQWAEWLADGHIVFVTHFRPRHLLYTGEDYEYKIVGDQVCFHAFGGVHVTHPVLNYDHDLLVFGSSSCGSGGLYAVTQVITKRLSDDQFVTVLVPIVFSRGFRAAVANNVSNLPRLRPQRFAWGEALVASYVDHGERIFEIAASGYAPVALTEQQVGEMRAWGAAGGELSTGAIRRMMNGFKLDIMQANQAALALQKLADSDWCPLLKFVRDSPFSYTPLIRGRFSEAKVVGREWCHPMIPGAVIASRSSCSDEATVQHRVVAPRPPDHLPQTTLAHDLLRELLSYADEWLELFCPRPHCLTPLLPAELDDRQDRPNQRRSFCEEEPMLDIPVTEEMASQFQKIEPYPEGGPPRAIINAGAHVRVGFGVFTTALADHCKQFAWYIWGASPSDIGDRLQNIAFHSPEGVDEEDFSKYDGSIPTFLRIFMVRLYRRCFAVIFWHSMVTFINSLLYGTAVCAFGLKYYTGSQQPSGRPDTSVGNTIYNDFLHYVARRRCGLSPIEAFDRDAQLGVYGGDDGVSSNRFTGAFIQISTQLGLKVKSHSTQYFVTFLGRVYAPYETNGSCIDPVRCLTRLHLTGASDPSVSDNDIAWRKLVALYITDSQTVLFRELCVTLIPTLRPALFSVHQKKKPFISDVTCRLAFDRARLAPQRVLDLWERPIFPPMPYPLQRQLFEEVFDLPWERVSEAIGVVLEWRNIKEINVLFPQLPRLEPAKIAYELAGELHPGPMTEPVDRDAEKALIHEAREQGGMVIDPGQPSGATQSGCVEGPAQREIPSKPERHCWAYLESKCTRPDCRFLHTACRDFARGRCKRTVCKFPHIEVRRPLSAGKR
jgi:hypothetical protein